MDNERELNKVRENINKGASGSAFLSFLFHLKFTLIGKTYHSGSPINLSA